MSSMSYKTPATACYSHTGSAKTMPAGCMYGADGTIVCGIKPLTYGCDVILAKKPGVQPNEACAQCSAKGKTGQ